jgi:uracil-DNA glycosylase family 4
MMFLVTAKGKAYDAEIYPGYTFSAMRPCPTGPQPAKVMFILNQMHHPKDSGGLYLHGQALINIQRACGVLRVNPGDWYVTGAIKFPRKCRSWYPGLPAKMSLEPDWRKACRAILERELRLVRPDLVICLGAEAAKTLTGRMVSIRSLRGICWHTKSGFWVVVNTSPYEPNVANNMRPWVKNFKIGFQQTKEDAPLLELEPLARHPKA